MFVLYFSLVASSRATGLPVMQVELDSINACPRDFDVVLYFGQVVKDLVTIFPVLRDWLADFLSQNCTMTASMIGRNLLIEQVNQ